MRLWNIFSTFEDGTVFFVFPHCCFLFLCLFASASRDFLSIWEAIMLFACQSIYVKPTEAKCLCDPSYK